MQRPTGQLWLQLRARDLGSGGLRQKAFRASQRTQYPLLKEYTLNYRGLMIVI